MNLTRPGTIVVVGLIALGAAIYLTLPTIFGDLASLKRIDVPVGPKIGYIPSPRPVVDQMLELAAVGPDDVVVDLGSGDGRILIAAAKNYGARGIGIERDPKMVERSRQNIRDAGVEDLIEIRLGDIFQSDFSEATVVTLYLLPELNDRLLPQLKLLKPGTRIVSHEFGITDCVPEKVVTIPSTQPDHDQHRVLLWKTPLVDK